MDKRRGSSRLSVEIVIFAAMVFLTVDCKMIIKDLSYTFDNTTLYWPSMRSERFRFVKKMGSVSPYYAANTFYAAEHGGTHLDAPIHFAKGKLAAAEIPITDLVGKAVIVNVTEKAMKNKDLLIGKKEFEEHEKRYGRIPNDSIILLDSGWGKYWPNATAYFGTASNNTSILHFPGLAPTGATWLIQNRKVKAVGIDTASIDYGQSKDYRSHVILLERNIPVFENVANLHLVPPVGAMVYALPMKISEGTGAPLRIVATWDDNKTSAGHMLKIPHLLVLFFIALCHLLL